MKTLSALLLCLFFCVGCHGKSDTADVVVPRDRVADADEPPRGAIAVGQPEEERDRYEVAIKSLAADSPDEKIDAALRTIGAGGKDAFDTLLAHMNNPAPAARRFGASRAIISVDKEGNSRQFQPSIGYVCFSLLKHQIENNFPKSVIDYYVLDESNIREWLAERKSKTIRELRVECAQLSLEAAKRAHDENPTEWTANAVQTLEENLAGVQAEL